MGYPSQENEAVNKDALPQLSQDTIDRFVAYIAEMDDLASIQKTVGEVVSFRARSSSSASVVDKIAQPNHAADNDWTKVSKMVDALIDTRSGLLDLAALRSRISNGPAAGGGH